MKKPKMKLPIYVMSRAHDIHLQFVHLIISSTDNARFQIFTSVNDPE
jgi:hypothetical protein